MNNVEKSESAFTQMLFPCAPDQFLKQIRAIVREEVMRLERNHPTPFLYETPGLTQKPVYKIAEVCQLFQVTKPTIHSWVRSGKLRRFKVNSRVYFRREDIESLLFQGNRPDDVTDSLG